MTNQQTIAIYLYKPGTAMLTIRGEKEAAEKEANSIHRRFGYVIAESRAEAIKESGIQTGAIIPTK